MRSAAIAPAVSGIWIVPKSCKTKSSSPKSMRSEVPIVHIRLAVLMLHLVTIVFDGRESFFEPGIELLFSDPWLLFCDGSAIPWLRARGSALPWLAPRPVGSALPWIGSRGSRIALPWFAARRSGFAFPWVASRAAASVFPG